MITNRRRGQRYRYDWNETGQLVRGRRWDLDDAERAANSALNSPLPDRRADADLAYAYGSGTQRVLKTATDGNGQSRHTLYVFPSLELRSTVFDEQANTPDYRVNASVAQVRLRAGPAAARLVVSSQALPSITGSARHLFLELTDHLQSTTFVIHHATGELAQAASYQSYGSIESDYRPERWGSFREPYQFTGKESDVEVGLVYFGARYYVPQLGVWLSADPVSIHDFASDFNPYAYVHSSPLMGVDPDGRVAPLVAIGIGALVGAVIAGGTSYAMQAIRVGHEDVEWGFDGVVGAMVVGAVAGAASTGVGSAVSGSIYSGGSSSAAAAAAGTGSAAASNAGTMALASAVGGFAGGAAGGAASYATISLMSGSGAHVDMNGFFESTGMGAAVGFGFGALNGVAIGLNRMDRITGPTTAEADKAWGNRGIMTSIAEAAVVSTGQAAVAYGFLTAIGTPYDLAIAGAASAAFNGAFAGARGIYNWESPSGYLAAGLDASVGLVGTTLGNLSNVINLGAGSYLGGYSYRQNRQIYDGGLGYADYDLTQGNVTSNTHGLAGNPGAGTEQVNLLNNHETLHTWQGRVFGPVYQGVYIAQFIGGGLFGLGHYAIAGGSSVPGGKTNAMHAALTSGYMDNPFEYLAYGQQGYWPPGGRSDPSLIMWH
jgi:RHS repeat-associated protein